MGEGTGPEASLALRCQRAGGALGMGVSSCSSDCRSVSNTNCAIGAERLEGEGSLEGVPAEPWRMTGDWALGRPATQSGPHRRQPLSAPHLRPQSHLAGTQLPHTVSSEKVPITDQPYKFRPTLLELSAPSTHWFLQNPTVATVALSHWSLWHWGRVFRGKSQISRESSGGA